MAENREGRQAARGSPTMDQDAQASVQDGGDDGEVDNENGDTRVLGGLDDGIRADDAWGYTCEDIAGRDDPREHDGDRCVDTDPDAQATYEEGDDDGELDDDNGGTGVIAGETATVDEAAEQSERGAATAHECAAPAWADDMSTTAEAERIRAGADSSQHVGREGRNQDHAGGPVTEPSLSMVMGGWVAANKKRSAQLNQKSRKRAKKRVEG